MERAQLLAARNRLHLSLEEVAQRIGVSRATVHRWEKKGDIPQPYHLRKLCDLYGVTARELGFSDSAVVEEQTIAVDETDVLASFRATYPPLRLIHLVYHWHPARYHELQVMISLELEDNTMNDPMSRRDALCFLALLPLEMLGLSSREAVLKHPNEEILAQCAAGIISCWQLRKGKELDFAARAAAAYIPTLKVMVQTAPSPQRKIAADLLTQCLLLKSILANHIENNTASLSYAQQAEQYSIIAENFSLQVLSIRTQANAYDYADQWERARLTAEKAKFLLETTKIPVPNPNLIASFIYAGLANYQGHCEQKQAALYSLGKAHEMFFSQSAEPAPAWVDHDQTNLLLHDGLTHYYLGMQKEAIDTFSQIETLQATTETGRIEALIDQVVAEMSRNDQPRDMDKCIAWWTRGMEGAKSLQSQQRFQEAIQAYAIMHAVWPGEQRVKELREYITHW